MPAVESGNQGPALPPAKGSIQFRPAIGSGRRLARWEAVGQVCRKGRQSASQPKRLKPHNSPCRPRDRVMQGGAVAEGQRGQTEGPHQRS